MSSCGDNTTNDVTHGYHNNESQHKAQEQYEDSTTTNVCTLILVRVLQ